MNVTLTILEKANLPIFNNQYKVDVKYMGGDANSYFTESNYFEKNQIEDLKLSLLGLHFMQHKMPRHLDKAYEREHIIEFFNSIGCESVEDEDDESDTYGEIILNEKTEDFIDNFVFNDDTDESYEYNAKVVNVQVFYYDDNGDRFIVGVNFGN